MEKVPKEPDAMMVGARKAAPLLNMEVLAIGKIRHTTDINECYGVLDAIYHKGFNDGFEKGKEKGREVIKEKVVYYDSSEDYTFNGGL